MDRADRIRAYFDDCTRGTPADIASHFTADAVVYDTNHDPVRTATGIGGFWTKIRGRWTGARWVVDSIVTVGDDAAIEWHMSGTGHRGPFVFRGSEHYRFEGDLIAEIRQYWTYDPGRLDTGLVGYPYDPTHGVPTESEENR